MAGVSFQFYFGHVCSRGHNPDLKRCKVYRGNAEGWKYFGGQAANCKQFAERKGSIGAQASGDGVACTWTAPGPSLCEKLVSTVLCPGFSSPPERSGANQLLVNPQPTFSVHPRSIEVPRLGFSSSSDNARGCTFIYGYVSESAELSCFVTRRKVQQRG